ncbi:hypothetical protein Tco_0744088 [Tanacetum coccineum]
MRQTSNFWAIGFLWPVERKEEFNLKKHPNVFEPEKAGTSNLGKHGCKVELGLAKEGVVWVVFDEQELYQIQPTMKGRFLDLMEGRGGRVVDGGIAAIPAGSRRTLYTPVYLKV